MPRERTRIPGPSTIREDINYTKKTGRATAATANPAAPKTAAKDQIENIAKYSAQTVQRLTEIKGVLDKIATMNKEVNIQIDGEKVAKAIEPYLGRTVAINA